MDLQVEKRDILGKKVRALREQGFIPAELYGHGVANLHLVVRLKDFQKVYKEVGANTVINVKVNGLIKPALIHDVQIHPLTHEINTVDFYEVRMDEEIKVAVPTELIGESGAVRDLHGVLIRAMDEIEVEALPADIPSTIKVDIAKLTELNQSIYVRDLPVTEKFRFTVDPDTVVVTVTEQAPEEVVPVAEVTPEAVIVEGEEKKAEREVGTEEKESQ